MGFGLGLFTSPNNSSVLGSVPRPRLGSASATVAQMRITGQVLGVAVGVAILASRISDHTKELVKSLPPDLVRRDALILAVHDAFHVAAAICVLGALASLIRGRGRPDGAGSGSPERSRRNSQGKPVDQSRSAGVYSPLDQEQL